MKTIMKSLYWVWLAEACGPASKAVSHLLACYEDPFDLYRLEEEELEQLEHVSDSLKHKLADKSLDRIYRILRACEADGIGVIPYADPDYPERLREIEDPPVVLYCKGNLPKLNDKLCIGMVGTRKMSEYGKQTAYTISYELAGAGAVVISGMALGVDGVCACGALESGGETVAVLGCGLDVAYPKAHAGLMARIAKQGAVLSEYPPGEPPHTYNFPKRNRIISGLSHGVMVIEGSLKSGSLITARQAIAQGREVFALPGKINETNSDGPNELIRDGAHVALGSNDVLNFYHFLYADTYIWGIGCMDKDALTCDEALAKYGVRDANRPAYRVERPAVKETVCDGSVPSDEKTETDSGKADHSAEILATLDADVRLVFERLPLDRAVTPDFLTAEGVDVGSAMMALSVLEVQGLVTSLPGGMYVRK